MPSATGQGLFEFTVDPKLGSIRFALAEWAKSIEDLSPAFRDIVTLFRRHERHHLESEGGTTGPKFPALSTGPRSYGKWKSEAYQGSRILQRDGVLYRALVEGGPGSIEEITPKSLRVGIAPGAYVMQRTISSWGKDKGKWVGREYHLATAALAHSRGEGPAYAYKNKRPRPPIRFNGDVTNRESFGYAVQQILQAHIVKARKKSPALEKALSGRLGAGAGSDRTIAEVLDKKWK